jgi:hypothetical protein
VALFAGAVVKLEFNRAGRKAPPFFSSQLGAGRKAPLFFSSQLGAGRKAPPFFMANSWPNAEDIP